MVALDDDSITDILQSRKIRSILGVEADSDGSITPLSDRSSQSAPKPPIRTRKSRSRRRFRRTSLVARKRSVWSMSTRTPARDYARRKRTPKRVRSLVNWFEKLAAKHQGTDPEETRMEVMGLEWKPGLHDIMEDRELNAALEYCEENLLYLKELRDLRGRFGGGAAIGRAHLSLSMPPIFGSDFLQTFSASEPGTGTVGLIHAMMPPTINRLSSCNSFGVANGVHPGCVFSIGIDEFTAAVTAITSSKNLCLKTDC